MDIFWQEIWPNFWQQFTGWEGVAVILAALYLLLAMRKTILCWYAAFISSAIYAVIFWDVSLLMESALSIYYVAMAVFGWYEWKYGGGRHQGVQIHRWNIRQHMLAIGAVLATSGISGYLLSENTSAVWPWLDSFTTWGAVLTTWMVARKVLENWIYWFVIDGISIFLYVDRGLYPTAILFVFYVIVVCFGYVAWRKSLDSKTYGLEETESKKNSDIDSGKLA